MAPHAPLLLLLAALAACATAPPPAPASAKSCVVAIALRTRPEREAHSGRPQTAYFVKLGDDADTLRQPVLLRSDFVADGVMYLFNAAPGRYAAVACYGKGDQREWHAYFPEDLIRATEKPVPEGAVVLLGSFDVGLRPMTTSSDAAQQHYFHLIFPDWESKKAALKAFLRDRHAWGGPWSDAGDEQAVLARMRKRLGPAWAGRFK